MGAIKPLELTILMPCLNEAETLGVCIGKAKGFLARTGIAGEVLIADNGSDDGSRDIAEAAGARVVAVDQKGYGAALGAGIAAARGQFVIMGDADDSYDFSALDAFVEALRKGADLVMGNRFKGGVAPGAMPWLNRYVGNPVLSFVGRRFFGSRIGDFHCGLRGFRRDAIRGLNLRTTGMEFASEMVVKATLSGLDITEVPTTLLPDGRSRRPHLRPFRDGWRHLRFLLLFSPRWLFLYPGYILLMIGFLAVAFLSAGTFYVGGVGFYMRTMLVAAMCIIMGTQAISFALIARRFATRYGFIPRSSSWGDLLDALTLERILIMALVVILFGVGGLVWALSFWAEAGFGSLDDPGVTRIVILAMTAIVTGLQMVMTGFLSSMMSIPLYERRVTDAADADDGARDRRAGES
jgi:glycosyltransferase involved in cell wall biosynthesis